MVIERFECSDGNLYFANGIEITEEELHILATPDLVEKLCEGDYDWLEIDMP
jgi:hypothetical protein